MPLPELTVSRERIILDECQDAIGYRFEKPELLRAALTHTSGANTRAASRNAGSFNAASACNGVSLRGRREMQTSRLGASNVANVGYVQTRRQNV